VRLARTMQWTIRQFCLSSIVPGSQLRFRYWPSCETLDAMPGNISRWGIIELRRGDDSPHSGLRLANCIALAHFSVSLAMSYSRSLGKPKRAGPPNPARRSYSFASTIASSISSLQAVNDGVLRISGS
jgi:hypothetical protein